MRTKKCLKCNIEKKVNDFYGAKRKGKYYILSYCKICYKKINATYITQKKTKEENDIFYSNKIKTHIFSIKTDRKHIKRKGSENKRKIFVGKSTYLFKDKESFKQINNRTFISNNGAVLTLNNQGYFKEILPFKNKSGSLQVSILNEDNNRKIHIVHMLVLKHFVGGYYKHREVRHIDGNKTNNKLTNLEWLRGFQNGIDSEYLLSLKDCDLDNGDIVIKNYLLYGKEWELIQYINIVKSYFRKILHEDFKMVVDLDQVLEEIYIRAKKDINNGKYIPISKNNKKYKRREFDGLMYFLRVKCLDFLYHYQKVSEGKINEYSKLEYVEVDDYDALYATI